MHRPNLGFAFEARHPLIRKGRARWVAKKDVMAQAAFIAALFGIIA